jgi:4-hydroxy-3-polyprenylbenzoate decarboxylase
MLSSTHDFINQLEHLGDLRRIEAKVSINGELAAIVRKISQQPKGGPALLFMRPDASPFPVAANLFGSRQRMRLALGVDRLDYMTGELKPIISSLTDINIKNIGRLIASHPQVDCCKPVTLPDGPCREDLELGADLLRLPFPQNWPEDGSASGTGRYITLGQVFTTSPDGSSPNCGIYRCQIYNSHTLAIRWQEMSGAWLHHKQFVARNERMPVAIAVGGPPSLTLTAAWPLPHGLDEVTCAGWLRHGPIPMVSCPHGPVQVPAEAEIVIEGFAEPGHPITEGPFGNHTGQYDPGGPAARITVTRITRRIAPIIPITVVGPPPQEDCWMMIGWERMLAAILPRLVPGVVDIRTPLPWVFRNSAVISVENSSPAMVRNIIESLWQLPWFSKARLLVIVDQQTNGSKLLDVAWAAVNRNNWQDSLIMDSKGSRLAIDATRQISGIGLADPENEKLIETRWKEYGLP